VWNGAITTFLAVRGKERKTTARCQACVKGALVDEAQPRPHPRLHLGHRTRT
jgi:hypothetical protein